MNLARAYRPFRARSDDGLDDVLHMVEDMLSDEQRCKKFLEVRGDEAQKCLDTLQLLADGPTIADKLRSSVLKMMLHLSKRSGLCPNCLVIKNVKRLGAFPVAGGGFGDVWKGKIGEQLVCLKVVKVYLRSDVTHLVKEYMREAIVWQQLKHPNLLPFVGMYYLDKTREQLCLVSPWMERGDLLQYLKAKSRKDVNHQALAYDVAAGLSYLHDRKIVHGDLKGVNILVTPDERACIGDFGLSRVADSHGLRLSSSTSGQTRGTIRWLAPELLEPPCRSSTRGDIYAYACIFTGNAPFPELADGAVIVTVLLHKKRPTRPGNIAELTDSMWGIMVSCWAHEASLRPFAEDVLSRVGALRSVKSGEAVGLRPAPDQKTLNLTQIWKNVKHPAVDTAAFIRLLEETFPPSPLRISVSSTTRITRDLPPPSPKREPRLSIGTSRSSTSCSGRASSPELLVTPLPSSPPPYIYVQLDSGDAPEFVDFDNEDFWDDDSWKAEFGPHIDSRASIRTIPEPLLTPRAEDKGKDQGRKRSPSRKRTKWHLPRDAKTDLRPFSRNRESPLSITTCSSASDSGRGSTPELLGRFPFESDAHPESIENFWDSWKAEFGPHIGSRASISARSEPLLTSRKDKDTNQNLGRSPSQKHTKWHLSRDAKTEIIPPERVFQECIIARRNASSLSQGLVRMAHEDFFKGEGEAEGAGNAIVEEFRRKCVSSQELITARIPWAFAGAKQSRREARRGQEETTEEGLLRDLLAVNEELAGSLGLYEALPTRLARKMKAEEQNRRDAGREERRDEIERAIHEEELYPSLGCAQPPLHPPSANLVPGQVSPTLVGGPRALRPNLRTGTVSSRPSSLPTTVPSSFPSSILSSGLNPSSIVGHSIDRMPTAAPRGPRSPRLRSGSSVDGSMYGSGG